MGVQEILPQVTSLVAAYEGREQGPVRFNPHRWARGLESVRDEQSTLAILADTPFSVPDTRGWCTTTRELIIESLARDIQDEDVLLAAFLLTMAWGSGTRFRSWRLKHVTSALSDLPATVTTLRRTCEQLRAMVEPERDELKEVADAWRVPGIGQSFYSKWFAFAGYVPGRAWQPLILDDRVRATFSGTLEHSLHSLTGQRYGTGAMYADYVRLLHELARDQPLNVDAARLEWILFRHNGAPRPGDGGD